MVELQTATGLNDEEFIRFVNVCSLRFQYQLPSHDGIGGREEARRVSDTEQTFRLLIEVAGNENEWLFLCFSEVAHNAVANSLNYKEITRLFFQNSLESRLSQKI